MKISVLLSITAATFAFVGTVEAQLPFPPSLGECLPTASDQASIGRCYQLQACVDNSSTDEQSLQDCIASAESEYLASLGAVNGVPPVQESVTQSSIVTDPTDSDYSDRDGEKGWSNTSQGAL